MQAPVDLGMLRAEERMAFENAWCDGSRESLRKLVSAVEARVRAEEAGEQEVTQEEADRLRAEMLRIRLVTDA
jgi:hypothetical protein